MTRWTCGTRWIETTRSTLPTRLLSGLLAAFVALTVSPLLTHTFAQASKPPVAAATDTRESDEKINTALRTRSFELAHTLIEERLKISASDATLLYNDACALAQLGRTKEAETQLLNAVKAGFRQFDLMSEDEDLEPIRASRTYEAIMEAQLRVERESEGSGEDRGEASGEGPTDNPKPARAPDPSLRLPPRNTPDPLAEWRDRHGEKYRYDRDEDGGLVYATYLQEASHERMKAMLAQLEKHLLKAYFDKAPSTPVLVAIVRPSDAKRYLEREEIKGMYLHDARRLVARDVGQSLQHEFVHLLHFAQMERTGQRHPIWIQEGLASLYENYTLNADGSAEFQPNIRFNFARRQVTSKSAMPWKKLIALTGQEFMEDAERLYPQVRAIFEYFAREGKLEAFYKALLSTWRSDPDGAAAIERAFGEPMSTIEERWKKWMIERGAIDDTISRKDASLGLVADDAGDGVKVKSFVVKSAARAAGLRVGDIIFSINGVPVRNREELTLAVARLTVGVAIRVEFRRDGEDRALELTPRALGS